MNNIFPCIGDPLGYHLGAWGGGMPMTLERVSKVWYTTWLQPSDIDLSVFEHEMGHGFGLPHSTYRFGPVTNSSVWDVMSDTY